MAAPVIDIRGLWRIYESAAGLTTVLRGVSLQVARGEFLAIMGPSGSGKSTLMNTLGCLDRPTAGSYRLEGVEVSELSDDDLAYVRSSRLGFVFQSFNLMPRATVLRNVMLPLVYSDIAPRERELLAWKALRAVGLPEEHFLHRANELSGGQMQRVAIARALVNDPAIILADEPTGALDSHTGREVIGMLQQLHREGHTVVLITHDNSIAVQAERIIRLEDGQVVYDGDAHAPEAVVQPTLSGEAAQEEAK